MNLPEILGQEDWEFEFIFLCSVRLSLCFFMFFFPIRLFWVGNFPFIWFIYLWIWDSGSSEFELWPSLFCLDLDFGFEYLIYFPCMVWFFNFQGNVDAWHSWISSSQLRRTERGIHMETSRHNWRIWISGRKWTLLCLRYGTFLISSIILKKDCPVKNVTRIFSCLLDGSLVWSENETKSYGNPILFS